MTPGKHDETPAAGGRGRVEHARGCLAGRENPDPAGAADRPGHGRLREGRRDATTRIDRGERRAVEAAQEKGRRLVHPNVILVRNTIGARIVRA